MLTARGVSASRERDNVGRRRRGHVLIRTLLAGIYHKWWHNFKEKNGNHLQSGASSISIFRPRKPQIPVLRECLDAHSDRRDEHVSLGDGVAIRHIKFSGERP